MNRSFVRMKCLWNTKLSLHLMVLVTLAISVPAGAEQLQMHSQDGVADRARAAWLDGAPTRALEILDQGVQEDPPDLVIQKLRGDIFATSRRNQEAIQAYEAVLQKNPEALDVRWVKWSVLLRSGQGEEAIDELQRIARQEPENPLIHMRLAKELRKLDRLEESLVSYQKAVELVPDLPAWRLALARARFDVLDGPGARDEIQHVLTMVSPGSPEDAVARSLLSVVYGATKERGRRFEYTFSPGGTAAERKEWSAIRADAWRLFEAGRYQEAEPVLRKVLELNPYDQGAIHDLGVTLLKLGQCEEALPLMQKVLGMAKKDEVLADTFFQMGICLTEMDRWNEALGHFEILYDAAVSFDESTKGVWVMPGIRVLDKDVLAEWKEKARGHLSQEELQQYDAQKNIVSVDAANIVAQEEEKYKKLAAKPMTSENPMEARVALMGRDADFSMFRYVISAPRVMRDDRPTGAHEFIPIDAHDTFHATPEDIYLVFGLVTASFDEVPLAVKCFLETSKIIEDQNPVASDQVIMAMNEQSGYFILSPSSPGWAPGLYRCGLFVGDEMNAYTHSDEVRFRIVEPPDHPNPQRQAGFDLVPEAHIAWNQQRGPTGY